MAFTQSVAQFACHSLQSRGVCFHPKCIIKIEFARMLARVSTIAHQSYSTWQTQQTRILLYHRMAICVFTLPTLRGLRTHKRCARQQSGAFRKTKQHQPKYVVRHAHKLITNPWESSTQSQWIMVSINHFPIFQSFSPTDVIDKIYLWHIVNVGRSIWFDAFFVKDRLCHYKLLSADPYTLTSASVIVA